MHRKNSFAMSYREHRLNPANFTPGRAWLSAVRSVLPVLAFSCAMNVSAASSTPTLPLMPAPAAIHAAPGARLAIDGKLSVALAGHADPRFPAAIGRALTRWQERTGLSFPRTDTASFITAQDVSAATLLIECQPPQGNSTAARGLPYALPQLGDDESYRLEVSGSRATLRAAHPAGILRGLETLVQLLQSDANGWFLPALTIEDRPRFPWRGLMIDVCRHWQPIEVIKRNLDGMASVKLNVLHLHLTEDQGFRIESKRLPKLHQLGSDGLYFTQDQIREIIAYAAERGIRVVPEFDIPGHATSWLVSYPELGSAPGPYVLQRRWGVFDPVLDPTNEGVYALLETFLGEMAELFPDPYIHIGGDENNGVHWSANAKIQAFIREHNLKDNPGIHAYFNRRIRDILQKHNKKLVGWDEVLHPDLPKDSVVHSWRGAEGLADAVRGGFTAILSNGYYIDLHHPAVDHYLNDPLPAGTPLTAEQQAKVLGGEATMWAEWVTPETIDSRIWPRTAAIAERLWSPREVNNVPDMYRRLAIVSQRLEETGLLHNKNRPSMIRRFAGVDANLADASGAVANARQLIDGLTVLVDVIEPVKVYARNGQQPELTQLSPLTGLPDMARSESEASRIFAVHVSRLIANPSDATAAAAVQATLEHWQSAAEAIQRNASLGSPRVREEAVPVAKALATVSTVAREAVQRIGDGTKKADGWRSKAEAQLKANGEPKRGVHLPMLPAITKLVDAAGQ